MFVSVDSLSHFIKHFAKLGPAEMSPVELLGTNNPCGYISTVPISKYIELYNVLQSRFLSPQANTPPVSLTPAFEITQDVLVLLNLTDVHVQSMIADVDTSERTQRYLESLPHWKIALSLLGFYRWNRKGP